MSSYCTAEYIRTTLLGLLLQHVQLIVLTRCFRAQQQRTSADQQEKRQHNAVTHNSRLEPV
jgi:hypothetical protein